MTGERRPDAPAEWRERWRALLGLERWLDRPMAWLGLVWLCLLVLELTRGLSPALEALGLAIWVVFVVDFALRLALAPNRGRYLARSWLTVLSLVVPALRVARVVRAARAVRALRAVRTLRGLRLVKVIGSINRAMRSLGRAMRRRRLGYVVLLTLVVTAAGAAGMVALEGETHPALSRYVDALWWTAMLMTTLGSESWPRTPEGRVLCVLLAVYAFAVFGYVTASVATWIIGRDVADGARPRVERELHALRAEVAALRAELRGDGARSVTDDR